MRDEVQAIIIGPELKHTVTPICPQAKDGFDMNPSQRQVRFSKESKPRSMGETNQLLAKSLKTVSELQREKHEQEALIKELQDTIQFQQTVITDLRQALSQHDKADAEHRQRLCVQKVNIERLQRFIEALVWLSDQSDDEKLIRAYGSVRGMQNLLILARGSRCDKERQLIATAIARICRHSDYQSIFGREEVRECFVKLANVAENDQSRLWIARAINNIVYRCPENKEIFGCEDIRDCLVEMGWDACSDPTRRWIASAMCSITSESPKNKKLFGTIEMRECVVSMGRAATSDETREWIAGIVINLTVDPNNRALFATGHVQSCLREMHIHACDDEVKKRIMGAITCLSGKEVGLCGGLGSWITWCTSGST